MNNIKTLLIILGNGFTIDFLNHMGKHDEIDVFNLFRWGDCVQWPADQSPGFLSYKNCPNLWNLGVRPHIEYNDAIKILEDIITCANVGAGTKKHEKRKRNIYTLAHKELSAYLKHLFVYYDKKISKVEFEEKIKNWSWYNYFCKLQTDERYEKVVIVTYNYDIWLERVLDHAMIQYSIEGLSEQVDSKFTIIKPHGSISFRHRTEKQDVFSISYDREPSEARAEDFTVCTERMDANYLMNAIVPPAGDSIRLNSGWASELRNQAVGIASKMTLNDEVIVCGISYWHVDRAEIDEIITSLDEDITVKLINPKPPSNFSAVLSNLFPKFVTYTSSVNLGV